EAQDRVVPKLGLYHPQTLVIQHNFAIMYRAFGSISQAIAMGEEVRERRVMILGSHHPATIDSLYNLGIMYQADRKPEKAMSLLEQAATGIQKPNLHRSTPRS
ncbi:MAG TPA: tetratricopeptide repeat protein, partial [Candidatus Binatia bacterium]|nr:tetratricopeptide repeat protein [Candidatus Binatia bacterium]